MLSTRNIAVALTIMDILKTGVDANTSEFMTDWNAGTIASTIALVTVTIGGTVRFIGKLDKTIASFMIGDAGTTSVVSTDVGK